MILEAEIRKSAHILSGFVQFSRLIKGSCPPLDLGSKRVRFWCPAIHAVLSRVV